MIFYINEIRENNHLIKIFSEEMARISELEKDILERNISFFQEKMTNGCCCIAMNKEENHPNLSADNIVGFVFLNKLGNGIGEISSAWVKREYRSKGIYSNLKNRVVALASSHNLKLIGTTKPKSPEGYSALISSAKNGILPVSFDYLKKNHPEAYMNCCSCSPSRDYIKCDIRDSGCILSIKDNVFLESISFQSSEAWKKMINSDRMILIKNITKTNRFNF